MIAWCATWWGAFFWYYLSPARRRLLLFPISFGLAVRLANCRAAQKRQYASAAAWAPPPAWGHTNADFD